MKIFNDKLKDIKNDGGLIMEYEPDELIQDSSINPESSVRLVSYLPDYIVREAKSKGNWLPRYNHRLDILMNAHDIWLVYQHNRA